MHCFVFEKEGNIVLHPPTPLGFRLDIVYYDIHGAYGYNGLISSSNDIKGTQIYFGSDRPYTYYASMGDESLVKDIGVIS